MKLYGTIKTSGTLQGVLKSERKTLNGSVYALTEKIEKDYNNLENKPKIEGIELIDNKTFAELGLEEMTGQDLINIFNAIWR